MNNKENMELYKIGQSFAKGSLYLINGKILSYLISLIGFLILARYLAIIYKSAEPLGLLFIGLTLLLLLQSLDDLGITKGIINWFILSLKKGEKIEAEEYYWTGFTYFIILAIVYMLLAYFLGKLLIVYILGKPEADFLIPIVSIGIVAQMLYRIAWESCILLDKTWINGIILIIYASTQYILSLLLLYFGYGIWGVALAFFVIAPFASSLPGLVIIPRNIKIRKPKNNKIKEILKFGFPLASASLVTTLAGNIYSVILASFATSVELGNYSIAERARTILDIMILPLTTLLFPTFSKLNGGNLRLAFDILIKFFSILIFPITLIIFFFPKEIIILFFGSSYINAWIYLLFFSIYWTTTALGKIIIKEMLASQGYTKLVFKITTLESVLIITLSFILIPLLKVIGAILALFLSFWPSFIFYLIYTEKIFKMKYNFILISKVFLVSLFVSFNAFLINLLVQLFIIHNVLAPTVLSLMIASILYIFLIKRIKLLHDNEILFIEKSLSIIPLIGKIISFSFSIYKKI